MVNHAAKTRERPAQGRDRRSACRYTAVKYLVFLGWWRGDEFHTVTAVLKDVSLGGASILLDGPAPEDALVWLSLYQVPPTQWVEATVVEVHKVPSPRWFSRKSTMIRIRFFENCSYDFFKVAIEDALKAPDR
jgi:hypothetical protein